MSDGKRMRLSLPEGGEVMLTWPDEVSLDSLVIIEEVLTLQLRSVRRAIERKQAWQSVTTPETTPKTTP